MEIIGRGFIAGHLAPLAHRHRDVIALAAGPSWTLEATDEAFARERRLVLGTAERARAEGRTVLFFSTCSAAMYAPGCDGTEDHPAPTNPYGQHKLRLEQDLAATGTDHLVLRLGHLVGAGQPPHQLVPTLVANIGAGEVTVFRGASRDLIDVGDVVAAIDALCTGGTTGRVVNIASGCPAPIEDVVDHLIDRLGGDPVRRYRDADAPSACRASVTRLHRLVPATGRLSGPDYWREVLDRYLATVGATVAA